MIKPTLKDVAAHMKDLEQALLFFNYYESQGWKVGKNPMKQWKSAATGWLTRSNSKKSKVDQALATKGQAVIDKFWRRMTEIYGHKWVSSYGAEPTKPWVDMVTRMDNEKIAYGLSEIIRAGDSWPPSLVEFNKFCCGFHSRLKEITHTKSLDQVLEIRADTREVMSESMSKIRAVLS